MPTTTPLTFTEYLIEKSPSWGAAILTFLISLYIAKLFANKIQKSLNESSSSLLAEEKRREMLITASRLSNIVILVIGAALSLNILGLLGNLGWLLGTIGLGLGLGLKGVMSNFVAGIGILLQDRTNIGDIVEINGNLGKIIDIGYRTTVVRQLDGIEIIVPNSDFFSNIVKVYTANPFRRLTVSMGVGYDTDFTLAEKVAREILSNHPLIEKKPDPLFLVSSIDNSTVRIDIKFWTKSSDPWWQIESDVLKDWFVKSQEAGIDISFPVTTLRIDDRESAYLGQYMKKKILSK